MLKFWDSLHQQVPETLSEFYFTLHHYSVALQKISLTYDDPKVLDGHMNSEYWLKQFSFLFLDSWILVIVILVLQCLAVPMLPVSSARQEFEFPLVFIAQEIH